MDSSLFNENITHVSPEVIANWMPIIEGSGKWKGFVDQCTTLDGSSEIASMAQILENTSKLIEKSTTANADLAAFTPIIMGLTRRVAADVIGNKVFGLQPLSQASGMAYAIRSVFSGTSETGKSIDRSNSKIVTLASATVFEKDGPISTETGGGVGSIIHIDSNTMLVKITAGDAAFVAGADVDNAATYVGTKTTVASVYENEALILPHLLPTYSGNYSTAEAEALGTDMKELSLDILHKSVTAVSKKLKTKWTVELEEDLQNEQGVSAEAVLSGMAKDQIISELNREAISKIAANIGTTATWDYTSATQADGRYEGEKYVNFKSKVTRVRDSITTKNMVGPATFAICGSRVLNMLETMGMVNAQGNKYNSAYRGNALGMDIYVDLFGDPNAMFLGRKGPTQTDAGIIFCPYIPIKMERGMGEETGQPVAFFRTRNGYLDNLFGTSNYYAKLTCSNLPV